MFSLPKSSPHTTFRLAEGIEAAQSGRHVARATAKYTIADTGSRRGAAWHEQMSTGSPKNSQLHVVGYNLSAKVRRYCSIDISL